jgi:hypothetical protein
MGMERRLQDLERKFENKERYGHITDVKFENQRWYVKMNDGEDMTPSGQESKAAGADDTFKSDWQPWQSFSHGTIKVSKPPKKGMPVVLRSSGGNAELSVVEPYHYGPDNPSPHGKEDEVVTLIEDEDEQKKEGGSSGQDGEQGQSDKFNKWTRETKDTNHLIIQKKKQQDDGGDDSSSQSQASGTDSVNEKGGKKKQKSRKIPEVDADGDDKTVQVKTTKDGQLTTVGKKKAKVEYTDEYVNLKFGDKKADVKLTDTDLTVLFGENKSSMKFTDDAIEMKQGDSTAWKMSNGKLEVTIGGTSWTLDGEGWKQTGGKVSHDGNNIGGSHKHLNVMPGPGQTGLPIPIA